MRAERRGATLAEVLVALACAALLLTLGLQALARAHTLASDLARRGDRLVAVRVVRHTLRRELGSGVAGRDRVAHPPDSLAVRVFRGVGLVCPDPGGGSDLLVRWSGARRPDPERDSLLLLDARGVWTAADLVGLGSAEAVCPAAPSETVERWTIEPAPASPPILARLFERSTYHVAGGAIRVRRGSSGREALTPSILGSRSGFAADSSGLRLRLEEPGGRSWPWDAFLVGRR